jgi:hypothetical protein
MATVVLATGGFAADRRSESYPSKVRPELLGMAATAGSFSTVDGLENCIADEVADMCYEKCVLYWLLSGLHTSTTLSIAKNYYSPSSERGENWEPNL